MIKNSSFVIKSDCAKFRSDRPCVPHKESGVECEECPSYSKLTSNIVILKFDALGDVLRSTSVLHGLRTKYPTAKITWYTRKSALPFFAGNSLVDEVLSLEDPASIWRLQSQVFDLVLSLDSANSSAAIARSLKSREILGFTINDLGSSIPASRSAEIWYNMGLNDSLKRANQESYFEHLYRIAELEWDPSFRPIYKLSQTEISTLPALALALGLDSSRKTIGLNPGAGGRWRYKRWNEAHYVSLIRELSDQSRYNILLLGGADDREIINRIANAASTAGAILIVPPEGDLRHFGMLLQLLDLLVCGDTLALHYGTALNKKVVALFGPTSAAEIDLFGIGEKVFADIPCRGCYLSDCDVRPTCMDLISPAEVLRSIASLLADRSIILERSVHAS